MVLKNCVYCLCFFGWLTACCPVRVHLSPETPLPPPDPACEAELLASDNNQILTRTFTLREETPVRIVGQA